MDKKRNLDKSRTTKETPDKDGNKEEHSKGKIKIPNRRPITKQFSQKMHIQATFFSPIFLLFYPFFFLLLKAFPPNLESVLRVKSWGRLRAVRNQPTPTFQHCREITALSGISQELFEKE